LLTFQAEIGSGPKKVRHLQRRPMKVLSIWNEKHLVTQK